MSVPYFEYDSEPYCRVHMPTPQPLNVRVSRKKGVLVNCIGCGRETKNNMALCFECIGLTERRHHTELLGRPALSAAILAGQPDTGEGDFADYLDTDEPDHTDEEP
jgi:hypothetical protein